MRDARVEAEEAVILGASLAQVLPPDVMAYINARVEQHRMAIFEQLGRVDAVNAPAIVKLQTELAGIDTAMRWLGSIVIEARAGVDLIQRAQFSD